MRVGGPRAYEERAGEAKPVPPTHPCTNRPLGAPPRSLSSLCRVATGPVSGPGPFSTAEAALLFSLSTSGAPSFRSLGTRSSWTFPKSPFFPRGFMKSGDFPCRPTPGSGSSVLGGAFETLPTEIKQTLQF